MLTAAPKDIRENVARAVGHLHRDEPERALACMSEALRRLAGIRLQRAARESLRGDINKFLTDLVCHPRMRALLAPENAKNPKGLALEQGKELPLATVLDGLAKILRNEAENNVEGKIRENLERKKSLLASALESLAAGQTARGRAFLLRIADEFSAEDGIALQLAQIFSAAGLREDAALMYEKAMEAHPREATAHAGAIAAWTELGDYGRAEQAYRAVLRTFGGHPSTYGKMAGMYLRWGRSAEAVEAARHALKKDPQQADALKVMEALAQESVAHGMPEGEENDQ